MVFVNKKGFPNDFIMYLPSLYSCEVINITICIEIVNGINKHLKNVIELNQLFMKFKLSISFKEPLSRALKQNLHPINIC